jgi:MFS family permease
LDHPLIPLFGWLSDRLGRRPVYLFGAVGALVWIFAFFPMLNTRNAALIGLATVVALVFHAAMYRPVHRDGWRRQGAGDRREPGGRTRPFAVHSR